MAAQVGATKNYQYRKFEIARKHFLGVGSFGTVFRGKCDELPCTAKVLHPTILDPKDSKAEEKFQEQVLMLKKITHPHLVQYLGFEKDPETLQPVLLMEHLDENLTMMLMRHGPHDQLPFHIQVDLSHDISLGLAYLHLNQIVHQNLTSNNVLVIAGRRAKVSDYGMAELAKLNPALSLRPISHMTAYMPPEAFFRQPEYTVTDKFDTYSLGVLLIQICTRQFTEPEPATRTVKDGRYPLGEIQVHVPETERRKAHFSKIDSQHPLLPVITNCLSHNEADRHSASEICEQLEEIKEMPQYNASERGVDAVEESAAKTKLRELEELLKKKEEELKLVKEWVKAKEAEIKDLQYQMDEDHKLRESLIDDKNTVIKHREDLIQEQIARNQKMEADCQRTIQNLSQEVEALTERLMWYRESEANWQDGIQENTFEPENPSTSRSRNTSYGSPLPVDQRGDFELTLTQPVSSQEPLEPPTRSPRETSPQQQQQQQPTLPITPLYQPWQMSAEEQAQQPQHMDTYLQKQIPIQELTETRFIENQQYEQRGKEEEVTPFSPLNYQGTPPESVDEEVSCPESDKIEMIMRDGENAPRSIMRGSSVVDGNTAYFSYGTTIFSYDSDTESWSILQTNALRFSSLEVVQGLLTTIGGRLSSTRETTDKLLSLVNELGTNKWVETFPSMPTKRCYTVTANTGKELIVAGGSTTGQPEDNTAAVEVMDVQTLTWCTAISLPMPITNGSMSICGEEVCVVGGKTIFTLPLEVFTNSFSIQKSLTERLKKSLSLSLSLTPPPQEVWTRGADIPVHRTTCASVNGQLLAIGGLETEGKVSAAIYKYDRELNCWEVITHMAVPRYNCHVAVLSSNGLMVAGGCTRAHQLTSSVEIAQIL